MPDTIPITPQPPAHAAEPRLRPDGRTWSFYATSSAANHDSGLAYVACTRVAPTASAHLRPLRDAQGLWCWCERPVQAIAPAPATAPLREPVLRLSWQWLNGIPPDRGSESAPVATNRLPPMEDI